MVPAKLHFYARRILGGGILWLLGAAGLLLAAPAGAPGAPIPVRYNNLARIGVSITADVPEIGQLMQHAFSVHGAFDVVAESQAQYVLRFTTGGGGVTVAVTPKAAGKTPFQASATGANTRQAAYRAADAVVEKITGQPGFFAGKLAFISQRTGSRELFWGDLFGQSLTHTNDHSTSLYPRWSPDGKKILYTGYYKSGFPDIILFDLAADTRKVFAGFKGTNTGGVFSPDGSRVAMILSASGNSELYVCDADGRNRVQLTKTGVSRGGPDVKTCPTWSPDGKQIILSFDNQSAPLLYQVSAAGGPLRQVPTRIYAYSAEPAWNPRDADKVAFMTLQGGAYQIAVFSFKDGATTLYTPGSEPCWTNDGRHIIFTKRAGGKEQLYLLDTDTRKEAPLTTLGASQAAFVYVK